MNALSSAKIVVKKHTGVELVQLAASFTSGHESKITLKNAYKTEHSIIRTQIFTVECYGIPLFVSTHFIRHHVGSQPYQLTCRIDRPGGGNPHLKERIAEVNNLLSEGKIDEACDILDWLADNSDRYTKVNLLLFANAQAFIDMAKLRLCAKASAETRELFQIIKDEIAKIDPDLAPFLVTKCIYRGGICCEQKCCGYNKSVMFQKELAKYKLLFMN